VNRVLTAILLGSLPGRVAASLRFGRPWKEVQHGQELRCAYFAPGALLCRVTEEVQQRRIHERVEVLRGPHPGERCSELVGVAPGAEILLRVTTPRDIDCVLLAMGEIECCNVRLELVSASYWRVLHNRLRAGMDPVPFSLNGHEASLRRRESRP
jgi:hypothetical protein